MSFPSVVKLKYNENLKYKQLCLLKLQIGSGVKVRLRQFFTTICESISNDELVVSAGIRTFQIKEREENRYFASLLSFNSDLTVEILRIVATPKVREDKTT